MNDLTQKHCVPCEGGTEPLSNEKEEIYLSGVPGWSINRNTSVHAITRNVARKNFKDAVTLVNQIAELAESEGHHPDLCLHNYKVLSITLTTHAINGLSENDFIMAAKINELIETN